MLKYTIIIPTCHKDLIYRCLGYIAILNKPHDLYEVLVIHNASLDNIKETVEQFHERIPGLRYIYEENYGQMYARHRGAREARGEILCFLDDDSFVDQNWLVAIENTFNDRNVILAGGNNLPFYDALPPKWLKYFWNETPYGKWMGQLSLICFRQKRMILPAWFAFGCNFIIRNEIFFKFGGTNPDVVPKDKQRFQGDGETALSLKLNKAGYAMHFDPNIKIHHLVSKERMTVDYFKKRAFYQGVCDSFSKIRYEHGFDYYDFNANDNIEKLAFHVFKRMANKIAISKLSRLFYIVNDNYRLAVSIKAIYREVCNEGYSFHQNEVKNDPELLRWVLRDNYLEL
jgi:GT2 family glycosyltransferase